MKIRRDKTEAPKPKKRRRFRIIRKTATGALAVVGIAAIAGSVSNRKSRTS